MKLQVQILAILLALSSCFVFTFNNYLVKEHQLDTVDVVLLRSIIQFIVLFSIAKCKGNPLWPRQSEKQTKWESRKVQIALITSSLTGKIWKKIYQYYRRNKWLFFRVLCDILGILCSQNNPIRWCHRHHFFISDIFHTFWMVTGTQKSRNLLQTGIFTGFDSRCHLSITTSIFAFSSRKSSWILNIRIPRNGYNQPLN